MSNQKVFAATVIPGGATTSSRKRVTTSLDHLSLVKKSKRSPPSTTTISDLSDFIVVEILCRLPYDLKVVFKCKRVTKRWYTLISDSYFVSRFLCQHDRRTKHFETSIVMSLSKDYRLIPLLTSSSSSNKLLPSILSMNFLPNFRSRALKQRDNGPIVEATFNDLVLCCLTKYYQRDYYICNPLTKQWVALPPAPRAYKSKVPVGFICDPYYIYGNEEQNSSILKLNADYRWRVVRIIPDSTPYFNVEIFSSETGEWREYQLADTRRLYEFSLFIEWRPGVACNGKLYWYSYGGFTFELDPFNIITTDDDIVIRFAGTPRVGYHLGVCQGRLRMYPFSIKGSISIWELKEKSEKSEWCLIHDRVSMLDMVSRDPKITKEKSGKLDVLGFLPGNEEDMVYLKFPQHIVVCYVARTRQNQPNPSVQSS